MLATTLLAAAILAYFYTAYMTFRLMVTVRYRLAWAISAIGLSAMVIRRILEFVGHVGGNPASGVTASHAALSLLMGLAMAAAVMYIRRLFNMTRETANKARENECRYRMLFEQSSDAIFVTDTFERITEANEHAGVLTGYTREQLLGLTWSELASRQEVPGCPEAKVTEGNVTARWNLRRRDCSSLILEVSERRMEDGRKIRCGRDITAREQALQRVLFQSQLLNAVQQAVVALDSDGHVIYWNQWAQEMYGWLSEEVMGRYVHDVVSSDVTEEQLVEIRRKLQAGERWQAEVTATSKSGLPVPILLMQSPLFDESGSYLGSVGVSFNISEQKRSQAALDESQRTLRHLIDSAPFGAHEWELANDGRLILQGYNDAAERILRVNHNPKIGKTLEEVFPVLGLTAIPETYRHVILTGEPCESQIVTYDDGRIKGVFEVSAVRTGPARMAAFFRDISDRYKVDEALKQRESRLRLISELAYQLMTESSPAQIVTRALVTIRRLFPAYRISYLQIDDNGMVNILSSMQPPNMPDLTGLRVDFSQSPGYLHALRNNVTFTTSDVERDPCYEPFIDQLRELNTRACLDVPICCSGKLVGLLSFDAPHVHKWSDHEITSLCEVGRFVTVAMQQAHQNELRIAAEEQLRVSEERFRKIFEHGHFGVLLVQLPIQSILSVNPSFCKMLGYTEDELRCLTPKDITWPEDWSDNARYVSRLCSNRIPHFVAEKRYVKKNGEPVWCRTAVSGIRDEAGQVALAVVIVEDISESRKAEEEKAKFEEQLRQVQKLETIGTLAAGIAHDFNNLLVPIIGYTELVSSDLPGDDAAREHLSEVLKAAYRAKSLVAQILAFSRQQKSERQSVNLHEVATEVVQLLGSTLPGSVHLRVLAAPNLPAVEANPGQIHQVLMNLCVNASQAMADGGDILISLAGSESDHCPHCGREVGGHYVHLSVCDTGCGMDTAILGRIFDPFFTTKGIGKGTGLGLAVTHGIIASHNGHICVESAPERGTTFHIMLPACTSGERHRSGASMDACNGAGNGERVLIIDDDQSVGNSLAHMLRSSGYEVLLHTDPRAALQAFVDAPQMFDVVLTDHRMPELSGDILAGEMRRIRPDIPIILCSANPDSVSMEELRGRGIDSVVAKPIAIAELTRALRGALASRVTAIATR